MATAPTAQDYLAQVFSYLTPSGLQPGVGRAPPPTGGTNPLAFLFNDRRDPNSLEDDDVLNDPFTPAARPTPEQELGVTGAGPGGVTPASGGRWENWLENPSNRSFMLSMGLQLMTGGWGNIGQQLAQGLGAGLSAANVQERRDAGEIVGDRGVRTGRGRTRLAAGPDTRTGVGTTGIGTGAGRLEAIRRDSRLASAEEFLRSNPTPEQWNAANAPDGLLHVAFGGPQAYETRDQLLHQVQDTRRRTPAPPTSSLSEEELIELGRSANPADQLRFDSEIQRRLRRSPGVGFRWGVDANGGLTRVPIGPQRGTGGRGVTGTAFSQAAQGGVDAARLTISNVRDWLGSSIGASDPTGITGMGSRAARQLTGVGDYARLMNSMKDGVMSYVHSRSGAQVAVREFEHYLSTRMPVPADSETTIRYKLADLELALMLIARRRGEPVSEEQLLDTYNLTRRYSNLTPITAEEFATRLPSLEAERGVRPGANTTPTTQPPPAVTPPVPRTVPPAAPLPMTPRPRAGTREDPHQPQTPEEAARVPAGQFFRTPDGRLIQRQ